MQHCCVGAEEAPNLSLGFCVNLLGQGRGWGEAGGAHVRALSQPCCALSCQGKGGTAHP